MVIKTKFCCAQFGPLHIYYTEEISAVLPHARDQYIKQSFSTMYSLIMGQSGPKHAGVNGFYNITVTPIQLSGDPPQVFTEPPI
jgi:hypothetical protein